MGDSRVLPIFISDDEEMPVAPSVAAMVSDADHAEQWPGAEWSEDEDVPRPDWLPDGFGMEGYCDEVNGTFQVTNFICPVSGISFGTKNEVLEYCFSGGMERAIEAKSTLNDKTTLQGKYAWLRGEHKWVLEIRAGGENMSKMFKVYAHTSSKVRLSSKAEVMRLIHEGKLPNECANDEDCNDTSNKYNIIAQLDFNVLSLPPGWVKETVFRKCIDGIRTTTYYTDPVTKKVFCSLKAAEQCFAYNKIIDYYKPNMSVTDLYSFDGCVDMPPSLARRLKMDGTKDQCEKECQTSYLGCSAIHFVSSLRSVNDLLGQTLTIGVGNNEKEVLHGDSKEKLDEEECHSDNKKEEYKEGDGNEKEDNEDMSHGDGKEDNYEPRAPHGSDKVGVNGEGMSRGDGMEDHAYELIERRFRSVEELYPKKFDKGNLKRKGEKKNKLV